MSSGNVKIGHPAPQFKATNYYARWSVQRYQSCLTTKEDTLCLSYPLDFAFACLMELLAFSDRAEELRTQLPSNWCFWVLTLSPGVDQIYPRNRKTGAMHIPLISEPEHAVAQYCGALKADEGFSPGTFATDNKGIFPQIT